MPSPMEVLVAVTSRDIGFAYASQYATGERLEGEELALWWLLELRGAGATETARWFAATYRGGWS
jgi:hypothetical protein